MEDMERVARAVVAQALSDAGVGIARGHRKMVSSLDRAEARTFLISQSGLWKQAREMWCSLADLDAEQLRERTLKLLDAPDEPKPAPAPPVTPKWQRGPRPPKIVRRSKAPNPGTKLSSVLYYLKRPEGVSLDELQEALQWNRNSAMSGIYDLRMFGIVSKRGEDGRYRLVQRD